MSAIPDFYLVKYRMRQFSQLSPEHQEACKRYSLSQVHKHSGYISDFSIFYSDCFLKYVSYNLLSNEWFDIFLSTKALQLYRTLTPEQQDAAGSYLSDLP